MQAAVSGSGASYTVTVTGMTGDGTVRAAVLAGSGSVGLNASGQNNLPSAGSASVAIDTARPAVTIDQAAGQADPTNAGPVQFLVQFDEPVAALTASDVTLTSSIGDPLAAVVTAGPAANSYVVSVTGMTADSTVTAAVPAGATTDPAGNGSLASTSTDNAVRFDNTRPLVTVTRAAGQADPTAGPAVVFDVAFSESVVGFDGSRVDLSASTAPGTLVAAVAGPGPAYTVTVTGMAAGGSVTVAINAGAVADPAGNPNLPVAGTAGTVTYVRSGTVQFAAAAHAVFEQGSPALTLTVTRTGGSEGPLDVWYATADGTAVAGTDYAATTGTLHWDAGDTAEKTVTVQLLDDGGSFADSAFAVQLTTVSLPGALGSPATSAVTIYEETAVAFTAPAFASAESGTGDEVLKQVTVSRRFGSHGAASVEYTVTAGSATAGADYTVPAATGVLTWADGDTADQPIDLTVLDDALSEGQETVLLTLSTPGGNAALGDQSATTLTIARSDGTTIVGASPRPQSTFTDADGDRVTLRLGGRVGTLSYYLTDGSGPISEADLAGTSSDRSVVSVTVRRPRGGTGDGRVGLGELTGTGVRSLSLARADVSGAGIGLSGFVRTLRIGDLANGADITLPGAAPLKPKGLATTITLGRVRGTAAAPSDITVAAPVRGLTAVSIGEGAITAPSIGALRVTGRAGTRTAPAVAGDLLSDITVAGTGLASTKARALGSVLVKGAVTGSTIRVGGGAGTAGSVGAVSVGAFRDSRLFAGYTGPPDGSGAFNPDATVGPFRVRATTDGFVSSHVIASNFTTVTLASAEPANGGTRFGFVFRTWFGGLTVRDPRLSYDRALGGTQLLAGDFEVKQV